MSARRLEILATLSVAACTANASPSVSFSVQGVGVVVQTDALFAKQPDLPGRIESTVDQALQYWGGTWGDLQGMTIILEGEQYVPCSGSNDAIGCYDGNIHVSTRDPTLGSWHCVEETVLVHEIGHAIIGDPDHNDPRWMNFLPVLSALGGRVGYSDAGEVPCDLYVSVWRHVLSSP